MICWKSPNKKLQSKLNAISLDVFFEITNDDINAWNIKDNIYLILLDLFKIQDIVNVIINEYFITTVQEDTTFYFSHPICFTFDTIYFDTRNTKDLVILENQICHDHKNCQCQHCLFYYYMPKLAKYYNQIIQFECKKRKSHEWTCGDCCLKINDEECGFIYVDNNIQLQEGYGNFNNCHIQACKGSYKNGYFIVHWEFVMDNSKFTFIITKN
jgi:hypothetical protein